MAGIYIHIPFCKQKCNYCNFFSSASSKNKEGFITALLKEIALQQPYINGEEINTIYFGGGTPSLLTKNNIEDIFNQLHKYYSISKDCEITLEANPDDLDRNKLTDIKNTPVNRLSMGIQSFDEDDLKYLNRIHSSQQAVDAIKNAQDIGFNNITIDLIYGIPGLTDEKWNANLTKSFELDIPHISSYCLTIEEGTALHHLINKGKAKPVDEEQGIRQFELLMDAMKTHNYIHYEISNFCKEGFVSIHNSNYWRQQKYLGLGPSAHSYNYVSRQWNTANITKYIASIDKGIVPFEMEILTDDQKYNEYILTSLRTIWGVNIEYLKLNFNAEINTYFDKSIQKHLQQSTVEENDAIFTLSRKGKFIADGIASDLFI